MFFLNKSANLRFILNFGGNKMRDYFIHTQTKNPHFIVAFIFMKFILVVWNIAFIKGMNTLFEDSMFKISKGSYASHVDAQRLWIYLYTWSLFSVEKLIRRIFLVEKLKR